MTTEKEDERVLIFSNLVNGVPAGQVAQAFHKSEEEVQRIFSFVLRKIKSYVFERKMPMVIASTVDEVRSKYKMTCLRVLPKLNLDKDPKYKNITTEKITSSNVLDIARGIEP